MLAAASKEVLSRGASLQVVRRYFFPSLPSKGRRSAHGRNLLRRIICRCSQPVEDRRERTALLAGEVREQRLELRQREARVRSEWAVRAVLTPYLHGIFEIFSGNKNISKLVLFSILWNSANIFWIPDESRFFSLVFSGIVK